MSDLDRPVPQGDFQPALPSGTNPDDRLQQEAPTPESGEGPPFAPRDLDVRRKLGPPIRVLVLPLVAMAIGSWLLAGGLVWGSVSAVWAGALLLVAIGYLPSIDSLERRQLLTFGYVVLCWAVWTAIGYFLPLSSVKVETALGSGWEKEPDCPMRIVYGWQVDVKLEHPGEYTIEFRGRFDPGSLRISTLTPTGWAERSFDTYTYSVVLKPMPTTRLYIDNRKHGIVTVGCGRLSFLIEPGKHRTLRIAAPIRRASYPVTIDDNVVGELSSEEDLLLDTLGTRSYRLRKVVYGNVLEMMAPRPAGLPEVEVFRGRKFHKLGLAVDYFLEPAPKEIKSLMFAGKQTRCELTEIEP